MFFEIADSESKGLQLDVNVWIFLISSGVPIRVKNLGDGTEKTDPLELYLYLNKIG